MVPFDIVNTAIVTDQVPEVTSFQAKAALARAGYLNAINAYMAKSTTDPEDKLRWDNAPTFRRDHPLLLKVVNDLMIPPQKLDELFETAKTITL